MFPHLITIGSFSLPSYGVLVALAFLVALGMASHFAKQRGLNSEKIVNLGVYCALAGMLGAKLLMIAFDWPDVQIFSLSFWQAAGVFQGGLILALITAYFYLRHNKMPLLESSDAFAPEWPSDTPSAVWAASRPGAVGARPLPCPGP
jgi:phosphatidylglycerol:prolipoprotein diacylglycerol transferase